MYSFVTRNATDREMQASNLFLAKVCSVIADIFSWNFSLISHTEISCRPGSIALSP